MCGSKRWMFLEITVLGVAILTAPTYGAEMAQDDVQMKQPAQSDTTEPVGATNASPSDNHETVTQHQNNPSQGEAGKAVSLEEIVVTAEKRDERLIDVPSSISVLSGESMETLHANSLTDVASYIPGLSIQNGGSPGQNTIVIRGLSTGYFNIVSASLVGTYIDDTPVGSSTAGTRGASYGLDLMPDDIEQIEVLKGPQGTLYGADAMGGLIKYELRKPDLTQFDARMGGDLENVDGSNTPGRGGHGSINMPIVEGILGLRLSGFYENNAGYIHNVGTGVRDSNQSTESGGRVTLLWQPMDRLAVQATFLEQEINVADETGVNLQENTQQPIYGPDSRSTFFPEPYKQTSRDYSLNVKWSPDFATLTSSTSWSKLDGVRAADLSTNFGQYTPGNPDALALSSIIDNVSKFAQEVRLSSPDNQRIQWMLGGYYTHEDDFELENVPTFTPSYVPLPHAQHLPGMGYLRKRHLQIHRPFRCQRGSALLGKQFGQLRRGKHRRIWHRHHAVHQPAISGCYDLDGRRPLSSGSGRDALHSSCHWLSARRWLHRLWKPEIGHAGLLFCRYDDQL